MEIVRDRLIPSCVMYRTHPPSLIAPPRLMDVLLQVEEALEHPWTNREMAERAGLSISRFYEVFLAGVGEPPMQYLERLRLERAAIHLVHSPWRILEIAILAGFESHAGFTHAFTARFGVPPSVFRERHGVRERVFDASARLPKGSAATVLGLARNGEPKVDTLPGFRMAFVRQWGYDHQAYPAAWSVLSRWVRDRGLDPSRSTLVGCHYDDVRFTPLNRCRYDAGIEVDPDFDPRGEVAVREVPSGPVAHLSFEGPPEGLRNAWQTFTDSWLPHSGYLPRTLYVFDLLPGSLLARDPDSGAPRLPSRIRSTLCIPVSPSTLPPPASWTAGPLDGGDDVEG